MMNDVWVRQQVRLCALRGSVVGHLDHNEINSGRCAWASVPKSSHPYPTRYETIARSRALLSSSCSQFNPNISLTFSYCTFSYLTSRLAEGEEIEYGKVVKLINWRTYQPVQPVKQVTSVYEDTWQGNQSSAQIQNVNMEALLQDLFGATQR